MLCIWRNFELSLSGQFEWPDSNWLCLSLPGLHFEPTSFPGCAQGHFMPCREDAHEEQGNARILLWIDTIGN